MIVDIYIRERSGSREIRIPWLPEEIEYKSGGVTMASYDIMNQGEVAVAVGTGLSGFSWEGIFPGDNRTDCSMQRGTWNDPKYYHNILEDWRKNGTPLHLMVTGYPINKDVLLEDYEGKATGGFGDWEYELRFLEDRDLTVKATKVKNSGNKRSAKKTTSYTVKKGDTLWAISQRFLGAGSKWETIYNANKAIIESTAKRRWKAAGINRDSQHGHWIFPGTKLTIPK